ncbi:MAG: enoyl-CoA hydratase/isomerase family protein [Rhodospirillaceae bacterium]|nr:enoyl-CoA hydratase/isomerase family protein [Rhodospirillaceae bacterium]
MTDRTDGQDEGIGVGFDVVGRLGVITLDRPKALNALTLPMIDRLRPQLADWAADDAIAAVAIHGAGERAFCAGGDVIAIYQDGLAHKAGAGFGLTHSFFIGEYSLNHQIHTFPKPYVSLVNGISMGGGFGLSVHGSHRVVTERTTFAMPEVGIGLFPDVGGTWFLPRCPGRVGRFLGLTAHRCDGPDGMYVGYGTHAVSGDRMGAVLDALTTADWSQGPAHGVVDGVLAGFAVDLGPAELAVSRPWVDAAFGHPTVEAILDALDASAEEDAHKAAAAMRRMSPTSLKLALEALTRGADMAYSDCVTMEYRLMQSCMARTDFFEGIRALLIDKDKKPRWQPADLPSVTERDIAAAFAAGDFEDLVVN